MSKSTYSLDNVDPNADAIDWNVIASTYTNMLATGEQSNFSESNRKYLKEYLFNTKPLRAILEIGVENNVDKNLTSTATILANKDDSTIYIGVDIDDRKHLDNPAKNVYTIQTGSQNIQEVMNFARSKGVTEIDFLFIDGWHSINQCIIEWEGYTPFLSKHGIVGFHDTNHHPGPRWLVERTDRRNWNVIDYPADPTSDFGIGFAWRK